MSDLREINIDDVVLRDDITLRTVDEDAVLELAQSISKVGLNTPIRVRPVKLFPSGVAKDAWELIAGRHRLEACKLVGLSKIEAKVDNIKIDDIAELVMIDENLVRRNFKPNELCFFTARRKEIYLALHPETRHGENQHSRSRNNCDSSPRFSADTASKTGQSERAIQQAAMIGERLGKLVFDVDGTELNTITGLEELARVMGRKREGEDEVKRLIGEAKQNPSFSLKAQKKDREPAKPKPTETDEDAEEQRFWAYWAKLSIGAKRRILPHLKQMTPPAAEAA